MAWRSVSSFASSDLDLRSYDAAITHSGSNLYLRVGPALRGNIEVIAFN
jgi:hypothetical protein